MMTYPAAVEVRPGIDPEKRPGVLIQFEYGWLVLQTHSARDLAARIIAAADEVDAESPADGS